MTIIHRVTFFNIPKPEDIDVLLAEYRRLAQEAKRVCILRSGVRSI